MRLYESQRGQVLPIVALLLAVLMGFAAFAVDLGYLRYQQRLQQTASDHAAIAAAWQLQASSSTSPSSCGDPAQPGSPPAVCTAGQNAAAANWFTNNGPKTYVSVNYPPASGAFAGDPSAVETVITVQQPSFFSWVFNRTTNPVTTRAVAIIRGNPNGPCLYALTKQMNMNAGSRVNAPCGIMVGGDFNAASGSTINVPSIGFVGTHSHCGPCTSATVQAQIEPFADPCPTIPGCVAITGPYPNGQQPGAGGPYATCSSSPSNPTTLTRGCYTGDLNGNNVDLQPGLYVFTGSITANNITCTTCVQGTSGVTLVVGGNIDLNGASTTLNAPPGGQGVGSVSVTADGVPGVVLYQTGSGHGQNDCTNPSNAFSGTLLGMVYAPNCQFNVNAGSQVSLDFLVVNQIEANGIILTVPNTGNPGAPQTPTLAE